MKERTTSIPDPSLHGFQHGLKADKVENNVLFFPKMWNKNAFGQNYIKSTKNSERREEKLVGRIKEAEKRAEVVFYSVKFLRNISKGEACLHYLFTLI